MLKIASRWLQLLRGGQLSGNSLSRILNAGTTARQRGIPAISKAGLPDTKMVPATGTDYRRWFSNQIASAPGGLDKNISLQPKFHLNPPGFNTTSIDRHNSIQRALQLADTATGNLPSAATAKIHLKNIRQNLRPAFAPGKELNAPNLLSKLKDFYYKGTTARPIPVADRTVALKGLDTSFGNQFLKNVGKEKTHKIWGMTADKFDPKGAFFHDYNAVVLDRLAKKQIPYMSRHEFAHASHFTQPQAHQQDTVRNLYRIYRQYPELQRTQMFDTPIKEMTAQLIASKGNSQSASNFINNVLSSAKQQTFKGVGGVERIAPRGTQNLINDTMRWDPTGRTATALLQTSKNYGYPLPSQFRGTGKNYIQPYLP